MTTHGTTSKWIRLSIATALASATGIALSATGSQAALDIDTDGNVATLEELTRFEIDGDKEPGVSSNTAITNAPGVEFDWTSQPYGPQPIGSDPTQLAPAGIGSSGLLPLLFENIESPDYPNNPGGAPAANPAFGRFGETEETCTPAKEDGWVGGTKVTDVNIDDPVQTVGGAQALHCTNVLGKGDLVNAYAAYEVIAIPNEYGNPDAGSQEHTIVYGGWERDDDPGELNFYIPLADDIPGNSAGDYLIAFDYDSSAPASFRVLNWDGNTWVVEETGTVINSADIFAGAVGNADGSDFSGGNAPTFGEFALDITAAGILPTNADGSCVNLSTGGFVFTETGNSGSAQLKDYVGAPVIPIGNCGPVQVTKAGPAGAGDLQFDYRLQQLDSDVILETGETQIDAQFAIGDTDVYAEVFADPDYFAFENPLEIGGSSPAALPDGWEMSEIRCSYIDSFTRVDNIPVLVEDQLLWSQDGGRETDGNGDLITLQVHSSAFNELAGMPDFIPGCTITNSFTGVTVTKAGVGDDTQAFDIDLNGEAISPALTIGDTSDLVAVNGGDPITVAEGSLPAGWVLESIVCSYDDGNGVQVVADTTTSPATFDAVDGQVVNCVVTNNELPTLTLVKEVSNDNGGTETADQWTLTATGTSGFSGTTPASSQVEPGSYDLSESGPADYTGSDWSCTAGTVDADTVAIDYGDDITCTIVNDDDPPSLTLVKEVVNDNGGTATADQWTLVADGYDSGNPQVGSYDLSETGGPDGYTLTSLTCDNAEGQVTSVTLGLGESVTCTFVNDDDAPSLTLVKQVINDNGGTATAGQWTLVAAGYDSGNPQAGSYDLSETGGPDGYTLTSLTCDNAEGQVASVTLGLGEDVTCTFVNDDDAPSLTLVKEVINDDGGEAVPGDWTLVADGYDSGSPQAGTYDLSETDGPGGYVLTSLTCDNAEGQVASVTLDLGEDVTCTFVNDDEPVDLQLTKDDAGAETVAGGDPFDYTIAVSNVGDRDVDADDPVTVTDDLPEPLEWVSFPSNCSQAGQVLTCDIDPALLPAGGDPVVITASVQAPAGTPTADYVNRAAVTTEDDPATDAPCPAADDNNVDCEETPVLDADLAIVKTASVEQIGAGGGFDWVLDITNNGPTTAVNVVIGDLVPAAVTVTAVTSDDFDCGFTGNDVECTIDSLALGEGGTVTISVTVPTDTAGGDVVNVGTVESDTPDPDLTNNSDDASVVIVAQEPPPPEPPPVTLPPTGSDATFGGIWLGAMFVALGGLVLMATRRRQEALDGVR